MKTNLTSDYRHTHDGKEADRILRNCVHCGFCNATCPTYQLLGDELDGPRGRIYLIKQMLEGETPGKQTQLHLDRCLTCRNCESTCPSGVQYSQLLNIGRSLVNKKVTRSFNQRSLHFLLRKLFLNRLVFSTFLGCGHLIKRLLPASLGKSIPEKHKKICFTQIPQQRKILLVSGCVQSSINPNIDTAAKIILNRREIECVTAPSAGCCGSLSHHLNAEDESLSIIKKNIDNWWPLVENNVVEAICMTASGCGVAIKEYGQLLADDHEYAIKAKNISAAYKDPAEIISAAMKSDNTVINRLIDQKTDTGQTVAFHPPCTLQHGMKLNNIIEPVLSSCGFTLLPFTDKHLCCGSAGTYSITQKKLSRQLLSNKLTNIKENNPDLIVTANIGCQLHLQSGTSIPVKHWLELLV